jgi:hypothetical protein
MLRKFFRNLKKLNKLNCISSIIINNFKLTAINIFANFQVHPFESLNFLLAFLKQLGLRLTVTVTMTIIIAVTLLTGNNSRTVTYF